jgi:CheY-like chemotaxis protein
MNLTDELSPAATLPPRTLGNINRPRPGAKVVRVLVLDDNEDDFAFVRLLLGKSLAQRYEIEWAQTEAEALAKLKVGRFDVGLFDYKLGGTTGLEILRTLHSQQCEIPIILLTGSENPEIDQAALDAGAADYLCKGSLDTTRLERAIRYSISHAQMLSALRESQAQLQLFMHSVPCAVCIYDAQGGLLFQNEIFRTHFSREAIEQFQQNGAPIGTPTHYFHASRHWLLTSFPMVEKSGRHLLGIAAIDITTRINAEEALRKTSEFLNGMLATLPVAVARVDAEGIIREARGQALAALQVKDNDLTGESIHALFPDSAAPIQKALGGGAVNFISELKQGGRTYYFDNYYRYDRARGAGAMGFSIDVTARIEAEKVIKQKSQLLNGLLENLPMIVGRLDAQGVIVEAQGQQLEKYDMVPAAMVGESLVGLYPQLKPARNGSRTFSFSSTASSAAARFSSAPTSPSASSSSASCCASPMPRRIASAPTCTTASASISPASPASARPCATSSRRRNAPRPRMPRQSPRSCRRRSPRLARSRAAFAPCSSRPPASPPRWRISRRRCSGCTASSAPSNRSAMATPARPASRSTSTASRRRRSTTPSSTPPRAASPSRSISPSPTSCSPSRTTAAASTRNPRTVRAPA